MRASRYYFASLLPVILVFGLLAIPLSGQDTDGSEIQATADPSGTWRRHYEWSGSQVEEVVRLDLQEGGRIVGTLFRNETPSEILDGRYEGGRLSFSVRDEYQGTIWTTRFSGVIQGDDIDGTVALSGNGQSWDWPWTPKRIVRTEDVWGGYRGSYFVNGEIHVNTYGTPEGRPLTTGHWDFKPSWSKTGDRLVFFRRLKDDPVVTNWKTAICIINVDGTGFHQLTDGTHTDFNQTWTRDGSNTPIWNRRNPETGGFYVMRSKVGNRPGQEVAMTDKRYHTWAYTCLMDGRILVQSAHPVQGYGYFLMTPSAEGPSRFERIDCELATRGLLDRVSVSPSETRVCFEYQTGFDYQDAGRTLYLADFDAEKPSITNAEPFANAEGADRWFAYPRWTRDEAAIVYHASPSLYLYTLKDGVTRKVSMNPRADYRYPHCEATPK